MQRRIALLALVGGSFLNPARSQPVEKHDPATQMLPDARGALGWSVLSATTIRRIDGRLAPDFAPVLQSMNGRIVKVQGYILPLEVGISHRSFLLSAWSPSCPFCLSAGPEAMMEVRARAPVKYSVEPVVIEGRLQLLPSDPGGMFYRLLDAAASSLP